MVPKSVSTVGVCSDLTGTWFMLSCCITGRQLLEVFTSLLGRFLSSIHNLLVSVKCRRLQQQCM